MTWRQRETHAGHAQVYSQHPAHTAFALGPRHMDRAERTIRLSVKIRSSRNLPVGLIVNPAIQQGLHVGQRSERL
ncbi:MAG: hypothetical protein JW395_3681 [Nitrospira sp.]|nr:hypothetical protein [Nitrospira sp.]